MEETNKETKCNMKNLDEKTLTAIQLLKDVRKQIAAYQKNEKIAAEPSSSNSAEVNAYKAVEEVLPRMIITPMLSAQIERHKDNVAYSKKENELMKQINDLRTENKELKEGNAKITAENKKVKAELTNVQDIIKGLDLEKVPEGIQPKFRQLLVPRARKIVKLEGIIKEITKEKEAMAKELADLKNSNIHAQKTANTTNLEDKELRDIEALLDEPDPIRSDSVTPYPVNSNDEGFDNSAPSADASARKRLWQDHSETTPNSVLQVQPKKCHNEEGNAESLPNEIHHVTESAEN